MLIKAPDGATRTSAAPEYAGKVEFHCYRTGISRYEWRDASGVFAAGRRPGTSTYWARIGDAYLTTRYRTLRAALHGAAGGK